MTVESEWNRPRCLVVEDNDDWFEEICRALLEACPNAMQPISRVKSFKGYVDIQREKSFAVSVLDIRLALGEGSEEWQDQDILGGLVICPQLPLWNPEAIVILFSAYIGLDEAVLAMRSGAWNCINKVQHINPIERLVQSVKAGIESRTRREDDWFAANVNPLQDEYGGRYIAVVDGQVVESGYGLQGVREMARRRDPMMHPKFYLVPPRGV